MKLSTYKRFASAFILVLICFLITSCSFYGRYGKNVDEMQIEFNKTDDYNRNYDIMDKGPVKGGTLKLFCTVPDTLNPLLTKNLYVQQVCGLIFDSLVTLDQAQNPVPVLCKDWNISKDGYRWTFNLRDDILWHDNTPFTSEDVEFTLDIILKSDLGSSYSTILQNIDSYIVNGKHSIILTLKKPNSFTAEQMCFPIISKNYYMGSNILDESKNMSPVGTGAYKFNKFENNVIKLYANEERQSYIEEIEVKIYQEAKDALSAFQKGEVDILNFNGTEYDKFKGRTDLNVKEYISREFEFIAFNTKNKILQDKVVRQSIAYSIDRKSLVDQIIPGKAVLSDIPVKPDSWLYNNNAALLSQDRGIAKEILINSGWKEEKGIFYKRIDGRKRALSIEILVNENNNIRKRFAEKIKEQLLQNGIEVKINVISWEEELKKINSGDFEAVILGLKVPLIPDVSYLYSNSYLNSYSTPTPDLAFNISGYDNYNINTYIDGIFNEYNNESKKMLFNNMKSLLIEDVPYIGLFFYRNAMAYNNRIKGNINPVCWNLLNDITGWYIPD